MKKYFLAVVYSISFLIGVPFVTSASTQNNSILLDRASSQYLYIDDASQTGLSLTGDFTLAASINLSSLPTGTFYGVVAKFKSTYPWDDGYGMSIEDDGGGTYGLHCQVYNSNSHSVDFPISISTGVWYDIACVYDASTHEVEGFLNGASLGTQDIVNTAVGLTSDAFSIGRSQGVSGILDGYINDARVWSRKLNSTEIAALHSSPCIFSNSTSLEGWWKLNGTAVDYSTNSNNLTNNNAAVYASVAPYSCPSILADTLVSFGNLYVTGDLYHQNSNSYSKFTFPSQPGMLGVLQSNQTWSGYNIFNKGPSATTTVDFGERGTVSSHSCFNTKNTDGDDISFYFVGTSLVVENNECR